MFRRWFRPKNSSPSEMPVFSLPEGVRAYAVGDIHGRADLVEKMLAFIAEDAARNNAQQVVEIFLGDYIDRGGEAKQVIEQLIRPPENGHERVCLCGNHEQIMLEFLDEPQLFRSWSQHGAMGTFLSYGVEIPRDVSQDPSFSFHAQLCEKLPDSHLQWLEALKASYSLGDYFFAHAGINPEQPLEAQDPSDLYWIRREFLEATGPFEKYIVHGHTPQSEPELLPHRANLDVSAAETDQLACLIIQGSERHLHVVEED